MPDFTLTPEQEALQAVVRDFARKQIAPVIGDYYERGEFPYPLIEGLGKLGLFGLGVPESQGGSGGDVLDLCLVIEELARVDSSVAVTLEAGVGLGVMGIARFGTAEQREQWLPKLCAGEMLMGFGLTEPGSGTDAGGLRTKAVLDGESWLINGTKEFITNAGTDITGAIIVAAATDTLPDGGKEISTIIVPSGTPGLTLGPEMSKVGWCASDTREVSLVNVRVPAANLLGKRGRGYAQFLELLDTGRIAIAALATGLAQGCVDESLRYATERQAFGRPLAANQVIQFALADLELRAHTARLAYYDAAARCVAGKPFKKQAAIAKLYASDAAVNNARSATQIHGGYGFMNEFPVARMWRDAKILEIGEGTNEVQRMIIARELMR